jgi:uncharacterized protein YbjT (DUF2867 family)
MKKILVTGATGHTGSLVVDRLRERGLHVRALVRDRSRAAWLDKRGVEVVVGDLDDPDSLAGAVAGVDKIYLVTWNGPTAARQRKAVVDVARRDGRPHVVMGGALGPKSRIIDQLDEANRYLRESGLPWTILQPTFFMQNLMGAKAAIAQGYLYWDLAEGRVPAIDIRDIADSAAAVLTGEGHVGKVYDLTGPEAISFGNMARIFSKELGHDVRYVPVSTEAATSARLEMGYPGWIADGFGELMAGFATDWAADRTTDDVARLTGHPARSFAQFVRDSRDYFVN